MQDWFTESTYLCKFCGLNLNVSVCCGYRKPCIWCSRSQKSFLLSKPTSYYFRPTRKKSPTMYVGILISQPVFNHSQHKERLRVGLVWQSFLSLFQNVIVEHWLRLEVLGGLQTRFSIVLWPSRLAVCTHQWWKEMRRGQIGWRS